MIAPLTPNTQAILLLMAPLIVGRREFSEDLLTLGDYNKLARLLHENQKQPADLIGPDAKDVIRFCAPALGQTRLETLLGRGFLLSQAVDRWNTRSIWVISRSDPAYPKRIKTRLKEDAPPLLYGCGDAELLNNGGLAVVGSRHVDEELINFTEKVGQLAASAQCNIVSGGAKGIDRAAMHGALQAGGTAAGVMADSLERAALARDNREVLMDGRLLFISPYDPAAGFNVGHAMQRNKLIYALADAAFIVTSDFEKGGTWAGAIEQIERLNFVPVFVRSGTNVGKGNQTLLQRGAKPWPNPNNANDLNVALSAAAEVVVSEPKQKIFSFQRHDEPAIREKSKSELPPSNPITRSGAVDTRLPPSARLMVAVKEILSTELTEPATEAEVAEMLSISKNVAKEWLNQLVLHGVLEKRSKPTRYQTSQASDKLL